MTHFPAEQGLALGRAKRVNNTEQGWWWFSFSLHPDPQQWCLSTDKRGRKSKEHYLHLGYASQGFRMVTRTKSWAPPTFGVICP